MDEIIRNGHEILTIENIITGQFTHRLFCVLNNTTTTKSNDAL